MKKTLHSLLSLAMAIVMLVGLVSVGGVIPTLTTAAETPAYYVIDACDTTQSFASGAQVDSSEKMQGKASLRFGGSSTVTITNSVSWQTAAPENVEDWYLELWLYVDKTGSLQLNNSTLEINASSDSYFRWRVQKLGLRNGWNKIQLKLSSANEKKNVEAFTQISRIKLTLAATKQVTVRLDDICLSREATATDRAELQEAVTKAATFDTSTGSASNKTAFNTAKKRAEAALADESCSQREADVSAEVLNDAMNAFGFEGFTVDNAATYGYVDFSTMKYSLMDGFRVDGGELGTYDDPAAVPTDPDAEESAETTKVSTTRYTGQLLVNSAKKQTAGTSDLRFTFTYFDGEKGGLELRYGSTDGEKTALTVDFAGSNRWITTTVRVKDAALSRSIDNFDLVLKATGGATAYVRRVEVKAITDDDLAENAPPAFAEQTASNNIIGAGTMGYQMWFSAGDKGWVHWGEGGHANPAPGNGNLSFDVYPYVQDYIDNGATLTPSDLGKLGNGQQSVLFSSKDPEIVETHFQWISEYDIDCMAIQRFGCGFQYQVAEEDNHLVTAVKMAEKYNKAIYVMYDVTGQGTLSYDELYKRITTDFVLNVERSGVASSTGYAHADGKPVVCIWGISGDPESTNYPKGDTASRVIRWFQERGYYVIVGTPDNNYTTRTGEYLEPYLLADMISPWTVGRYSYNNNGAANWIKNKGTEYKAFGEEHGSEYQPVIFPGSSWIAMNHDGLPNAMPRMAGDFVWQQAVANKETGADAFYFAMFDEYDEGTAYMKGATDYFEIPTAQYFVTYAADGQWLSNDYYLRVAQRAIQLLKDENTDDKLNIPYSQGPVYWRNSFEKRWTTWIEKVGKNDWEDPADKEIDPDNKYTILSNIDVCIPNTAFLKYNNVTLTTKRYYDDYKSVPNEQGKQKYRSGADYVMSHLIEDSDEALKAAYATARDRTDIFRDASGRYTKSGEWAFQFVGEATGTNAYIQYQIANTDVMVSTAGLQLDYSLYAVTDAGCSVYVDLLLDNGQLLSAQVSDIAAVHGKKGQWVDVSVTIPTSLVGRRIKGVVVSYEGGAGNFDAYIDDVILQTTGTEKAMLQTAVSTASKLEEPSEALTAAVNAGQAVLNNASSTAKQCLAAVQDIDLVLYNEGNEASSNVVYGDVNGDGSIDTGDARLLLQYAAELIGDADIIKEAADLNGDGVVDTGDARLALQYAAEIITKFPVEG